MNEEVSEKDRSEEQRQDMIAQGRDHLANVETMGIRRQHKEDEIIEDLRILQRERLAIDELRITWLERLAMMMRVDVSRVIEGKDVLLVWADTDGDPVTDEEDGGYVNIIEGFDDISKMVISRPKVVKEEQ